MSCALLAFLRFDHLVALGSGVEGVVGDCGFMKEFRDGIV